MKLAPVVKGQVNQGLGWQDWGQIIILRKSSRYYEGCWATGHAARWYVDTGGEVHNGRCCRIHPDDLAALAEHFAAKETTDVR